MINVVTIIKIIAIQTERCLQYNCRKKLLGNLNSVSVCFFANPKIPFYDETGEQSLLVSFMLLVIQNQVQGLSKK